MVLFPLAHQARHPDGDTLLLQEFFPLLACYGPGMPGDVRCLLFSH